MNKLFSFLSQKANLKDTLPPLSLDVIEAQKALLKAGFVPLPEEFIGLLKTYNGLKADDGMIFGISPKNKDFDIIAFNKAHNISEHKIILGFDSFDFLVFDVS